MLPGTKKFFDKSYENFKESMIAAAEEDLLPAEMFEENVQNLTMKDLEEIFFEFNRDTSLEMSVNLFFCQECGHLHAQFYIDPPEENENRVLQ